MLKRVLKILGWTTLAVALITVGLLLSTVKLLSPDRITPLTETVANGYLNADVSVGKVELTVRQSWPFLELRVDSLVVVSRDIKRLPKAQRDTLPVWADTLVTIGEFRGGISLPRIIGGVISLNDVRIVRPQVNLLIVNDTLNNFSIIKPSESTDTTPVKVPDVRIRSFRILQPHAIRYADIAVGNRIEAMITTASLESESPAPDESPRYFIDINTNIESPLLHIIGLLNLPVSVDGTLDWKHDYPLEIALNDFSFALNKLKGDFNLGLDFSNQLTVSNFNLAIQPISITDMLQALPEITIKEYNIPTDIESDAQISLTAKLNHPYVVGQTVLPHAEATVDIGECYVQWRKLDLRRLALNATMTLNGANLNSATVTVNNLLVEGPATTLSVKGKVSELLADPLFNGDINGKIVADRLPPMLKQMIPGSLRGTLTLNTTVTGRPSMFSRDNFHLLRANGDVKVDDLYYVADDTLAMAYARTIKAHFSTNHRFLTDSMRAKGMAAADSLLAAQVEVDTVRALVSGLDIKAGNVKLGFGALNTNAKADTTLVIPMGGGLKVSTFSIFTLSDTTGIKVRNLDGRLTMRRYKGDAHLPIFNLNANVRRISAGDNTMRLMVSGSKVNINLNKIPENELSRSRRQVKQLADSIRRVAPDLSIDSVYQLAMEIRRRNRKPGSGTHLQRNAADDEIIEWGTSGIFKRILLDWNVSGDLTAKRAGLYTAAFPLRNRLRNLNMHFTNDSLSLTNVEFKAGRSDFMISGNVTNIKRAFTSRSRTATLKVNFNLLSDTIDVNQIAKAVFMGAASSHNKIKGDFDNEEALQVALESKTPTDTVAPVLIPVNIDAQLKLQANNVLYSDFVLHDLKGTILAYDGALNLNDLHASSKVGALNISALYAAPNPRDMKFGFGMDLKNFNIHQFLDLAPGIDSLMPILRDVRGIINAKIAATADVDDRMNLELPTLSAAVNLQGDSLVLLDKETYRKIGKWLLFKDKQDNMIKHLSVDLVVDSSQLTLYPFILDLDRYRIGVQGHNDLNMNLDYHISVLKSPLPFKFGITIKGTPEHLKFRLGRSRFNEKMQYDQMAIADTTRINLLSQFENVFRRGVQKSEFAKLRIAKVPEAVDIDLSADTLTHADSLYFIKQGLIPAPPAQTRNK